MKKKLSVALLAGMVCVISAGCGRSSGISQSAYDAVVSERNTVQNELEELKNSTVSKEEYDAVVSERDELQKIIEDMKAVAQDEIEETEENEAGESEQKSTEESNDIISVGDAFEANGMQVSIDGSDLEYWTYDTHYDGQVYGHGMKYVGIDISVKNVSDSEKSIMSYDFDCYADDALCDRASFYSGQYGYISAGRTTSFSLYWKVSENASSIEIEYSYRDGSDKKTKIIHLQ